MSNKFWKIRNQTTDSKNEGELLLYGDIGNYEGWNDVTAKQFNEDLKALGDVDTINVRINSVGGSVFAGQAIHSMLKRHKATVNVYVDGLAASIASVVAMAGDTITIPSNAMMMIHNPWTGCWGNANDFRKVANDLDKIGESIISAYEGKCKKPRNEIKDIMDAETWLTAQEAVDLGFADVLDGAVEVAASITNKVLAMNGQQFDLSKFNNVDKLCNSTIIIENKKEDNQPMEITASMLKEKHPDVFNEIANAAREEGVQAERTRIKALEDISAQGCEEIVNKAKYETFASAEKTAMEVLAHLKANPVATSPLASLVADAGVVNTVPNAGVEDEEETKKQEELARSQSIKNAMLDGANSRK